MLVLSYELEHLETSDLTHVQVGFLVCIQWLERFRIRNSDFSIINTGCPTWTS